MKDEKMLKTGLIGCGVAAICCFTPALVLFMGAVGLSGLVGWWLDLLLFPALAGFLFMTGFALFKIRKRKESG